MTSLAVPPNDADMSLASSLAYVVSGIGVVQAISFGSPVAGSTPVDGLMSSNTPPPASDFTVHSTKMLGVGGVPADTGSASYAESLGCPDPSGSWYPDQHAVS